MGIRYELSSSYNPSSNGLNEVGVRVVKETMEKTGVSRGVDLDCLMFDLNSMARGGGSGTPIELFLGRTVNTSLPTHGNKYLSIKRDMEERKKM